MTRALIYCRYSPRPDEQCESLDFQEDFVRRYFDYLGIEVGKVIGDPETSARVTPLGKRKGGAELLTLTTGRRPAYSIVGAYRLDRLFRDVVDGNLTMRLWKRSGVTCHFAAEGGQSLNTSTATGQFIINILLAKAAYEPALTSERTSAAMLRHIANGRAMSKEPPYGMKEGDRIEVGGKMKRTFVPCDQEQAIIGRIMRMHDQQISAREIARVLQREGVPCRGEAWRHKAVGRIIKRAEGLCLKTESSA